MKSMNKLLAMIIALSVVFSTTTYAAGNSNVASQGKTPEIYYDGTRWKLKGEDPATYAKYGIHGGEYDWDKNGVINITDHQLFARRNQNTKDLLEKSQYKDVYYFFSGLGADTELFGLNLLAPYELVETEQHYSLGLAVMHEEFIITQCEVLLRDPKFTGKIWYNDLNKIRKYIDDLRYGIKLQNASNYLNDGYIKYCRDNGISLELSECDQLRVDLTQQRVDEWMSKYYIAPEPAKVPVNSQSKK